MFGLYNIIINTFLRKDRRIWKIQEKNENKLEIPQFRYTFNSKTIQSGLHNQIHLLKDHKLMQINAKNTTQIRKARRWWAELEY